MERCQRLRIHYPGLGRRPDLCSYQTNQTGLLVYYAASKDKQGRSCAVDVTYAEKRKDSAKRTSGKTAAVVSIAAFFILLAALTFVFRLIPIFILPLYAVTSTITFIA